MIIMRTMRLLLLIWLALGLLGLTIHPLYAEPGRHGAHRPDTILVKFRPGAKAQEILRAHGASIERTCRPLGVHLVRLPKNLSVRDAIERIGRNPNVIFASANHVIRVDSPIIPNDALFDRTFYIDLFIITLEVHATWGFRNPLNDEWDSHATDAWSITTGSPNMIIAVIDSGIDDNHPDLQGRLVPGYNPISSYGNPNYTDDDMGHGTFVAGIAGATGNNGIGIAGMDWHARLMPIKVISEDGTGDEFDAMEGIVWAADHGAKILNMSFGTYLDPTVDDPENPWYGLPALREACNYAWNAGCLLVAASGNDGYDDAADPHYPSYYDTTLSVGATNELDQRCRAEYDYFTSNYGDTLDVMAPGAWMVSCVPYGYAMFLEENYYDIGAGTSASAPFVSGLASLIWGQHPTWSNWRIREQIIATCTDIGAPGKDRYTGWGRIDAYKALTQTFDYPTIASVRNLPVDSLVCLTGKIVTAGTDSFATKFYIEEPDRSSGILVDYGGTPVTSTTEGQIVNVIAKVGVTADGQIALVQPRVTVAGTTAPLKPLGMLNRSVGGKLSGYLGVTYGQDTPNTGLLIRVWGKVVARSLADGYVYIDDGCALDYGWVMPGLKVYYAGQNPPLLNSYVAVTGISSFENTGSGLRIPVVRARRSSDIVRLN